MSKEGKITKGFKFDGKVECLKQTIVAPQLGKYKIPVSMIDKSFKFYYIHLKCSDIVGLYRAFYELPVEMLCSEKSEQIYTFSYRSTAEGKCQIFDFPRISNNFHLAIPSPKDKQQIQVYMENDDKSDKIVAYPIVYNYQMMGYLLPNSVLDERYVIKKVRHAGVHVIYGWYRTPYLEKQIMDEVEIYSLKPWDDIKKMLKDD